MKDKSLLIKVPVKYGLIAGALNCILMFILYKAGRHPALLPPYLDSRILVFLIFIFFTLKEYRDYYNDGFLHMWEGLVLGFFVYTTVGVIGYLYILVVDYFDPEFMILYREMAIEGLNSMKEQLVNGEQPVKMSEEEFQSHINNLKVTKSSELATDYFIKSLLTGFLIPIIYTVFLRKSNR